MQEGAHNPRDTGQPWNFYSPKSGSQDSGLSWTGLQGFVGPCARLVGLHRATSSQGR